MFRVSTYLAPSAIHGIGVFTPLPIPAGTVIWEYTPGVDLRLAAPELEGLPAVLREQFRSHCYLEPSGMYVFCGDNARYMNHSFEPNCDDSGEERTVALRDIAAHEELTCDYRSFDVESATTGLSVWSGRLSRSGRAR